MTDDSQLLCYLSQLKNRMEKVIMTLPKELNGLAYIRQNFVHVELQGQRLGVFTLVLGSEAPELVYDGRYIGHRTIPSGLDAVVEFAEEAIDDVAAFILGTEPLVEHRTTILRRAYLRIPSNHGPEWKLKIFT